MRESLTVIAFVISFTFVFLITPLVRILAFRLGAVDIPKDNRRAHKEPIALLGGIAIFLAIAISLLVTGYGYRQTVPLLVSAAMMFVLGLVDDYIKPRTVFKFGGQVLIAGLLWWWGFRVEHFDLPGGRLFFSETISAAITIFWLVGITNAINFIDGLDGLAAGISTITALTFWLMLSSNPTAEYLFVALIAAAICGSCLGFLPYNFYPAKIFMGDAGAMTLGFLFAGLSVVGFFQSTLVVVSMPIIVLGVPIFDLAFAILRRCAKRQAPWVADCEHIHHRLMNKHKSQKTTVLLLYLITGLLCAVALFISQKVQLP